MPSTNLSPSDRPARPGEPEPGDDLATRKRIATEPGSPGSAARQAERGKLSARARIDLLCDPGTFCELGPLVRHQAHEAGLGSRPYTDGVVTGWGLVDGRKVCVFSQDFTVFGGSLGAAHAAKIQTVMDLAISVGVPLVGINDGAGARIQEGVAALAGYGGIFARNTRASGYIPQISVIMGPCAGGAVYSPALTDFVFMVGGTSYMFITGPDVVKAVTGESVTTDELGGARTHATRSGVAQFTAPDDQACLAQVRRLLSFLPANASQPPPRCEPWALAEGGITNGGGPGPAGLVPADPRQPYDITSVVSSLVDAGDFMAYAPEWATNLWCGFARIEGRPVGLVANQPMVLGGLLDVDACEKAARFVRTCDAFGLPLITLVDAAGFRPGADQEQAGLIRRGSKLLYAYCEATVGRIQVVLRTAYGAAAVVMGSKATGTDLAYAWPAAAMTVMNPQAAVGVLHHRELSQMEDPGPETARLAAEYERAFANPWIAAELGLIDDVIEPADTRGRLAAGLALLEGKARTRIARRHPCVPL
ncbi:MAG: acyl-CoA carboxylase subunit beta [Acidimicrobiales bacterium]